MHRSGFKKSPKVHLLNHAVNEEIFYQQDAIFSFFVGFSSSLKVYVQYLKPSRVILKVPQIISPSFYFHEPAIRTIG